ncbi:uncharacterized protein LOC135831457 [Planococcus citri]|uniref:uncharacterized protein LOC135831457 n=1 Tax=Planococcus citri TaxID=170843 RepID=UPI0031F8686E
MPVQDPRLENFFDSSSEEDLSEMTVEGNMLENIPIQLDAFEKRLLKDYSTRDTLPETELQLPTLLINSFSRMFRLWHKNPAFKNSIQSHVFYDIFSLMFRSLNEEPISSDEQTEDDIDLSNLTGVCDICDEEIEVLEGDAKKSFAKHARTETHIQMLNLLNNIGVSDKMDEELKKNLIKQPLEGRNIEKQSKQAEVNSILKENSHFISLKDEDSECCLCDIAYTERNDLINHCFSKIHNIRKYHFFQKPQPIIKTKTEFNDDLIFTRGKYFYCVLCQCSQLVRNRAHHVKESYHKGWKNFARKVKLLREPYMCKINRDFAFCQLCDTKFSLANGIASHCQTKRHTTFKHFANEILCSNFKGVSFRNVS